MTEIAAAGLPPKRIVIAGGGLAAWMAAAALTKAVNLADYSICVIGTGGDDDAPFGAADATLPSLAGIDDAPGLDEDAIVAETGGSFTFGIALSGWSAPDTTYFHPFGSVGAGLGPVPFHHLVLRLRRDGIPLRLANYSLAALAAQAGRFARPGPDPRSVLSSCEYGLHVDCGTLTGILRTTAESAGVSYLSDSLGQVEHASDGAVAALITRNGKRIEGDLFLDCTGVGARLIADASDAEWEDWSAWLPCDRILSASMDTREAPPPYSHAEAHRAGWVRHLPMQGKVLLTALHQSDVSSDDEAFDRLRKSAGNSELADPRSASVRFGRRRIAWHRNCVALGAAAALIDPVGITNLHLLRSAIGRLLRLLPGSRCPGAEAAEYNRQIALQLDHARDFAMLHYKLNGRRGESFWDACRAMPVPPSLDYKMRLFESRGRVAMYDEEPLEAASWINLFDEHGMRPRRYHPIADGFNAADLEAHVQRARDIMIDELGKMPLHSDYLSQLRAAKLSGIPDDPNAGRRHERHRVGSFMGNPA